MFHSKEFFILQISIKLGPACCQTITYCLKLYISGMEDPVWSYFFLYLAGDRAPQFLTRDHMIYSHPWLTCISSLCDFTIHHLERKKKIYWLITESQNTAVKHAKIMLEISCLRKSRELFMTLYKVVRRLYTSWPSFLVKANSCQSKHSN